MQRRYCELRRPGNAGRGADRRRPHQVSSKGPAAQSKGTLDGIRVLLVDDDKDIGEVLQFVLESQGAVVAFANSVAEALTAIERSLPNVLLSDIAMPGDTGYDLMRKIVARRGAEAPPAAAISAYAGGRELREALASGFQVLLTKPIEPAALIAAVKELALANTAADNDAVPAELESERR